MNPYKRLVRKGGKPLIEEDNPYKGSKSPYGIPTITKDKYKTPTTGFNKNLRARHEQQKAIKRKMK